MSKLILLWVFLLAVCACAEQHKDVCHKPDASSPEVQTPSGVLQGSWMSTRRGRRLRAFRGVRYAEPPVGTRRFQPPELITKYDGVVDAREDGPACPQPEHQHTDEDCLRLNVYTPERNSSKLLPVVVFMHAGGFYSGSGRSDVAGPHYLLDRDLVLVTINYRLSSLGFLSTGDELAPGNNGFKDQVAALRWVQRNIAAFGGDPDLVTLTGYSAGSISVAAHMASPLSQGLFHRAISMSGSPMSQIPVSSDQRVLAIKQARLLGCSDHSSAAILDCLRDKTAEEIANSLDGFFEYAYDPVLIWMPVAERPGPSSFLVESPLQALQAGRMRTVPHLVTQTSHEFYWKAFSILNNASLTAAMDREWSCRAALSFILPDAPTHGPAALRQHYLGGGGLTNDSRTAAALGQLYSDGIIGFGAHTLVNALATYSTQPLYYGQFAYVGSRSHYVDPESGKPLGAAHHDDLIYLFSLPAVFPTIPADDSRDSQMVDRMSAMWEHFAVTGDPNVPGSAGPTWPPFTRARRQYLRISDRPAVEDRMFETRFAAWEALYDPPHCGYCIAAGAA